MGGQAGRRRGAGLARESDRLQRELGRRSSMDAAPIKREARWRRCASTASARPGGAGGSLMMKTRLSVVMVVLSTTEGKGVSMRYVGSSQTRYDMYGVVGKCIGTYICTWYVGRYVLVGMYVVRALSLSPHAPSEPLSPLSTCAGR